MKKIIALLLCVSCLGAVLAEEWEAPKTLPKEFYVKERHCALTRTFDIESKVFKLGSVVKHFFSLTPTYTLYDVQGEEQARARARFFAIRTIVDVTNVNDEPIGMVEEQFSWFHPTFRIIDKEGRILARAQLNFWGTKFTFTDPLDDELVIASLSRPFFRLPMLGQRWTAEIDDNYVQLFSGDNALLFSLVAVYQTDAERHRQFQREVMARRKPTAALKMVPNLNEERLIEFHCLLEMLHSYADCYEDLEPSDEDIAFVEAYVDDLMAEIYGDDVVEMPCAFDALTPQEQVDQEGERRLESLVMSLGTLLPLLDPDNEDLTDGQKCALYHMLEHLVDDFCPCI